MTAVVHLLLLWCVISVVVTLLLGAAIGRADLHDEDDWSGT